MVDVSLNIFFDFKKPLSLHDMHSSQTHLVHANPGVIPSKPTA